MAKVWSDFVRITQGRCIDIDGSCGAQCWDLFGRYCQFLGIPVQNTLDGYARSLTYIGNTPYFKQISKPQVGCVGVWTAYENGYILVYGHVAMYNGNGMWYGQNQSGINCPYDPSCGTGGKQPDLQGIPTPAHMYMPYALEGEGEANPDKEFVIYPDTDPVYIWNGDGLFTFYGYHLGKRITHFNSCELIGDAVTDDMEIDNQGNLTWDKENPTLIKFKVKIKFEIVDDKHETTINCEFTDKEEKESPTPPLAKLKKFWMYLKPYKNRI